MTTSSPVPSTTLTPRLSPCHQFCSQIHKGSLNCSGADGRAVFDFFLGHSASLGVCLRHHQKHRDQQNGITEIRQYHGNRQHFRTHVIWGSVSDSADVSWVCVVNGTPSNVSTISACCESSVTTCRHRVLIKINIRLSGFLGDDSHVVVGCEAFFSSHGSGALGREVASSVHVCASTYSSKCVSDAGEKVSTESEGGFQEPVSSYYPRGPSPAMVCGAGAFVLISRS